MLREIIEALPLLMQIEMALTVLPFLLVLLSIGLHIAWMLCAGSLGLIYASFAKTPLGSRSEVVLQELRLDGARARISRAWRYSPASGSA